MISAALRRNECRQDRKLTKWKEHYMNVPVTTTFTIERHRINTVQGHCTWDHRKVTDNCAGNGLGGLKSIIGGRIGAYTEMCEQARQQAFDLIVENAREMGANAIVGLSYDASEVVSKGSATEALCYGTAVVIERESWNRTMWPRRKAGVVEFRSSLMLPESALGTGDALRRKTKRQFGGLFGGLFLPPKYDIV
jgi:uncharacterized protein YbjQ (UPF0145 family)